MAKRGGSGKWIVIILMLVAAAIGGFWIGRPDLFRETVARFTGPRIPELAESHFKAGLYDLKRDSYAAIDSAIDNLAKAVAIADSWSAPKAALAEAYLARAEWMIAEAAEDSPQAERLRSTANRHREEAFAIASVALKLDPKGLLPNRALAEYYRQSSSPGQMRSRLERARAAAPTDAGITMLLGSAAAADKALERATHHFEAALELDDKMQRARYKLALTYFRREKLDLARRHVEDLLVAVPAHERGKALLVQLDATKKEPEPPPEPEPEPEPAPKVKKRRSLDPEALDARMAERLYRKAELLRRSDRSVEALALYQKALAADPNDTDILLGLGWCHIDLEQPRAAIPIFDRVALGAPALAEVHMGLGEAYRLRGMKRDAIKHFRIFLDKAPYSDEAAVARRMIRELQ